MLSLLVDLVLYSSLIIIIQEGAEHAESRAFSATNCKTLDKLQTSPPGCFVGLSDNEHEKGSLIRICTFPRSQAIITGNIDVTRMIGFPQID
jgi:hypothetical protein